MVYRIGDRVSHPLHGAGAISDIVSRTIDGSEQDYYILSVPLVSMRIMIPVNSCERIGIRPIVSAKEAEALLKMFPAIEIDTAVSWNQRLRENLTKVKSGDLEQVLYVLKSLMSRDSEKGLSMGERKLFCSAKQIFISEMVLSLDKSYDEVEKLLCGYISA